MAFNLCVPEFNKADIAIYLQNEFLKKKATKMCEKNDNGKEKCAKRGKKGKVSFLNEEKSDDSSSNDEDCIQNLQNKNSCMNKMKRKHSEPHAAHRRDNLSKNTRETKLFRHF